MLELIRTWTSAQGGLRHGDLGKAVADMIKRWDNLTRFVDDGRIPLDNNRVQRALRKPVMGRKNHPAPAPSAAPAPPRSSTP